MAAAATSAAFAYPRDSAAQAQPAEIVELARALKNNPDLIYEYVYNNIETLPQYGSLKGPLGTLLDGKGTAFDQAELMVVLLQQAGFSAAFIIGQINITAGQLTAWLGTDTSVGTVAFTLGSGGFSGTITTSGGVVTGVTTGWAWVRANIGGTEYVFDPSTKAYDRSSGLTQATIATALGYNRSSFVADALSGSSSTLASITGVNRPNIRNDMTAYANNLVQYVRSNNPTATTTGIIGGNTIVPLTVGMQLRETVLPYQSGVATVYSAIPSALRTTLTLQLGSNDASNNFTSLAAAITFNSSDIYGRRIVASFNGSAVPSLLLDGVTQVTASGAVPAGRQLTIRTSIVHPYASPFVNVTNNDQLRVSPAANAIYVVSTGWGLIGRGMIEKHRKLLQQNAVQYPGNPPPEPVLGESLAMIGYTWLAEVAQSLLLQGQLGGVTTIYHHAVGIVGMKAVGSSVGPFVDLPLNIISPVQRNARPTSPTFTPIESAVFFCHAFFISIAESGTLEQTQPGAVAASTVKLVDTAVQSGGQIFDINNSAVSGNTPAYYTSTIRPTLLSSYGAGDLSRIDNLVYSQNLRAVAPANGSITIDQYTGAGYFQVNQAGTVIGAIITGGLSGGEPATAVPPQQVAENTQQSVQPAPTQSPVIAIPAVQSSGNAGGNVGITQTSNEPINLVTGDYLLNATDLTVGSLGMPYGLTFQRYYDSGTRMRNGPLGFGWTHNFALSASASSDAFEGMAANSPINGAVAIAATFVTLDILNDGVTTAKPLDCMVIASVVQRWLMDLLTNNVVAVTQPGYVEHFTKLADGTYNPPPGSAATLALSSGAYTYVAKDRTTLSFDTAGNLSTWVNPSGVTVGLTYSGSPAKLASVTNSLGRSLTLAYASDLLTQVADNAGRSVSYAYDSAGNLTSFTDPLGHATTYAYGLPGQLTQVFYPSQPTIPFVTNAYDLLGRVKTQAGANGAIWQYFFAGTRGEEDDPLGTQNVIYTTSRGRTRLDIKDLQGLNRVTTTGFDGLDRVILTTLPEGNTVGYTYDTNSNVLTVTATPKPGSPLSPSTTTYVYDPTFNKPTSVTDPLGLVSTFTYAVPSGNPSAVVADSGASPHFNARTAYTYNSLGFVATSTDPLGTVTQFVYDSAGNRLSTIADSGPGRLNQTTTFTYNSRGDVVSATDPRGNTATSTYDAAHRLVTTTAPTPAGTPNGVVTTNSYDGDGRLLQVQQTADGVVLRTVSTTYTPTGKPATTTDANGNITRFAYDTLDRRTRVTDAVGRVTQFTYTALSQPFQTFNTAIQAAPLIEQTYSANGRVATLTDANANTTSFAYDGFDRLATTTYPGGSTETFTYDAVDNLLTRKTRANGTIGFTYDTLNRLATKTPPAPAPVVTYSYDLNNRRTGVSDTSAPIAAAVPPSGMTAAYTASYTYDALNRLTGASWDPAPAATSPAAGPLVTFGHSYNAVNQRISQTVSDSTWLGYPPASAVTTAYTANALNQYTAVGAVTPTYDGNGNLTSDGTYTLGYDAENRLTSASGSGNSSTYAFDGQGRRKSRTVNGTITVSVTDADDREVLEYDGSTGAILRWYAYGLGSNDVLNQMSVVASTRTILLPDLQGSIIGTFDSSSGALTKFGYQPYGTSTAVASPFGYTGQRIDPETGGLYYYRARHYSSVFGRFLQADPVGYSAGPNLYAYVINDPLNLFDPSGLTAEVRGSSIGQSLLQGTVNAVPGAYYAGLAQQQFQSGNYGTAGGYAAASILDAALGVATFGLSTRVTTAVRATESGLSAAGQLAVNRAASVAFEQHTIERLAQQGIQDLSPQITVRTQSGISTRLDILARDPVSGGILCIECKSSATARLTPNQRAAFPEIGQSGATVVGQGKPAFPGGTAIPPTQIQIIRP